MKSRILLPLVAVLLTAFVLPPALLAQSSNVRPRNKNHSARFKSGILRGSGNQIQSNSIASFIGGGQSNVVFTGLTNGFIGGGFGNVVSNQFGTVPGGLSNTASGPFSAVGGGSVNAASGLSATVDGGEGNMASDSYTTVGGGLSNTANLAYATVSGGIGNTASGNYATISGGASNTIVLLRSHTTIAGGWGNKVSGDYATISGGANNTASGTSASIAGGYTNTASGYRAAAGGGFSNTVSGTMAVVPGGSENAAGGGYSFAAGRRAKANHDGCFVWADSTDADFASASVNSFLIRAKFTGINRNTSLTSSEVFGISAPQTDDYGGMYVRTSGDDAKPFYGYSVSGAVDALTYVDGADAKKWKLYTGGGNRITVTTDGLVGIGANPPTARLQVVNATCDGATWQNASDRNLKTSFQPVDGGEILRKVAGLPISEWTYKSSANGSRHVGPTAQDFRKIFGLGDNDKTISTIDPSGIALAAIQGLVEELKERDKAMAERDRAIEQLESEVRALREHVLKSLPPAP